MRSGNLARFNALRPYVEGRTVLDLGAARGSEYDDWLHGLITEVAADCVALDLDAEGIELLRELGMAGHVGSASDFNLDSTYDVVLAGELIEHLVDFEGFFESVRRHLEPGGRLVLTTPNAFGVSNFVYRLGGRTAPINPDHTCWFCADTLRRMLDKAGYQVEYMGYIPHDTPGRMRRVAALAIRALLPERLAWRTLLAVASPVPS